VIESIARAHYERARCQQQQRRPSASTTATSSHTKWQEDDGNSDTDEPIEQHDDGSVSLKFLVPSALMGFLIGKVRSCAFDIVVA